MLVDQKPMGVADILEYIKPKLERNPNKPVILQTDRDAHYVTMINVFDELRQAEKKIGIKVTNIAIPTQRDTDAIEALLQ